MTLDEIIIAMYEHGREHPRHGHNCSCRDKWIREARRRLTSAQIDELSYLAAVLSRTQ